MKLCDSGRTATTVLALTIAMGCRAGADTPAGPIAYIRGGQTPGDEIRLINADGTSDRAIWKVPGPALYGASGLSWRPDGKEIAFASDHDAAHSIYESDIYAIRPDGTGLRRITNPPVTADLGRFPQGKLKVTLANDVADAGPFLVYTPGASVALGAVVPPGSAKTVVFDRVADFGAHPHPVVAMLGKTRWMIPGPVVRAGQIADAGTLRITPHGMDHYGAFGPVWRQDGKIVAYILGGGAAIEYARPDAGPGTVGGESLTGGAFLAAHAYDLGPTPETKDQILYSGGTRGVALTRAGSGDRGKELVDVGFTEYVENVWWLPDGLGLLFSKTNFINTNIYRYDFASKQVAQLTHFDDEMATNFAPSPDGKWIVFTRRKNLEKTTDLWVMRIDGSDMRLLVRNGGAPAWGPVAH